MKKRILCSTALLLTCALGASMPSQAAQPLTDILKTYDGKRADVGLLVLGHSTSQRGDWPGKLAAALNSNTSDGRNYVIFRVATGGDGGFLWSRLSFPPSDMQYNRVKASPGSLAPSLLNPPQTVLDSKQQWCQDKTGTRWSCRDTKVYRGLTGWEPAPAECNAAATNCGVVANGSVDSMSCIWHDTTGRHQEPMTFQQCWAKMDKHIALVQDTTNRSWPVNDYSGNGEVNDFDYFKASFIAEAGRSCPRSSTNPYGVGTVPLNGEDYVDWNCDKALDSRDAAATIYAGWLQKLATDLFSAYGTDNLPDPTGTRKRKGVDHVFFMQKPVEFTQPEADKTIHTKWCEKYFPGENCSFHATRSFTVPSARPFNRFYLPTVYWEYRGLETLMAKPGLDTRIHLATDSNVRRMWQRSAECYTAGISGGWSIPNTVQAIDSETKMLRNRPAVITADDGENDASDSATKGCLSDDHIHHNDNGGWMMADVWYAGLLPYLQW